MRSRPGRWSAALLALLVAACGGPPAPTSSSAALDCPTSPPSAGQAATILADAQRAVVSTSQSTPFISSDWTAGSISPSSASTSLHRAVAPVTSRAIRNARTTSDGDAPVSVPIREANVMPWEFTTSFDAIVAMIWRFSGWSAIRWPKRSTIRGGKYRARSAARYSLSGRSLSSSSANT